LVARNEKRDSLIRSMLPCMPASQGGTREDGWAATTTPYA